MARPRMIHFFEEVLPEILPAGQEWLEVFHKNSMSLIEYLRENGAKRYTIDSAIKSLTGLRTHLLDAKIVYSPEEAEAWLLINDPNSKGYRATIRRLADLYRFGKIQPLNAFPMVLPYSKQLNEPWNTLTAEYLDTLSSSHGYLESVKNCVTRFLYGIQTAEIMNPKEITFDLLENYCQT